MITVIEDNVKKIFSRNEIYLLIAFFVFVLSILIFTFYSPNYYDMPSPVQIDIPKGMTLNQIIDSLYAKKIIPSKTNMKIAAVIYGAERKIKAGRYVIPNGLNYLQLIEELINPTKSLQVLVTIPEGIWQNELAKLLKENLGIDSAKVMELSRSKSFINSLELNVDNLEGYLLPESYYFYSNATAEEVLRRLKKEMDKFFDDPDIQKRMKELKMNKNQVLTLASIIDAESNYIPEFKRISGVYHNRLKRGMLLQADPTVQYLIRERENKRVYYKDLNIDSRFNTYKYAGLPPAPINNPGKDAIIAALFPEKHNYLFFVANGMGQHNFSSNQFEHQENIARYRKWLRSQNQY
ncbi:MAG: endolytic transglycosylase MltG [Melioribacter sp.]|uniref:endolytic transglycosylase MltG n=1 Tax=Rosettibacter primus TaxID=3111523 RepID=UPI00247B5BBA|nr:endolytic transglycosylase MltG [Melioribacter sp.]